MLACRDPPADENTVDCHERMGGTVAGKRPAGHGELARSDEGLVRSADKHDGAVDAALNVHLGASKRDLLVTTEVDDACVATASQGVGRIIGRVEACRDEEARKRGGIGEHDRVGATISDLRRERVGRQHDESNSEDARAPVRG